MYDQAATEIPVHFTAKGKGQTWKREDVFVEIIVPLGDGASNVSLHLAGAATLVELSRRSTPEVTLQ